LGRKGVIRKLRRKKNLISCSKKIFKETKKLNQPKKTQREFLNSFRDSENLDEAVALNVDFYEEF